MTSLSLLLLINHIILFTSSCNASHIIYINVATLTDNRRSILSLLCKLLTVKVALITKVGRVSWAIGTLSAVEKLLLLLLLMEVNVWATMSLVSACPRLVSIRVDVELRGLSQMILHLILGLRMILSSMVIIIPLLWLTLTQISTWWQLIKPNHCLCSEWISSNRTISSIICDIMIIHWTNDALWVEELILLLLLSDVNLTVLLWGTSFLSTHHDHWVKVVGVIY